MTISDICLQIILLFVQYSSKLLNELMEINDQPFSPTMNPISLKWSTTLVRFVKRGYLETWLRSRITQEEMRSYCVV